MPKIQFTEAELALAAFRREARACGPKGATSGRPHRDQFPQTPPASPPRDSSGVAGPAAAPMLAGDEAPDQRYDWRGCPMVPCAQSHAKGESFEGLEERLKDREGLRPEGSRRGRLRDPRHRQAARSRSRSASVGSVGSMDSVDSMGRAVRPDESSFRYHGRETIPPTRNALSGELLRPPDDPWRHGRFDDWRDPKMRRGRSRSPSQQWDHSGFLSSLKDPSPERVVPLDYFPPKPLWSSRAGGVYIPNR